MASGSAAAAESEAAAAFAERAEALIDDGVVDRSEGVANADEGVVAEVRLQLLALRQNVAFRLDVAGDVDLIAHARRRPAEVEREATAKA